MKNTVLHFLSSKLALATFVLAGFFQFAPGQVAAQANASAAPVKHNYVSEAEAINRLEIESDALRTQLESLVPETIAYKTAVSKHDLFTFVLNKIQDGKSVAVAVTEGFTLYDSHDFYASIPESIRTANKNELILILTA